MSAPKQIEWDIVAAWTSAIAISYGAFWTVLHGVLPWLVKLRIF